MISRYQHSYAEVLALPRGPLDTISYIVRDPNAGAALIIDAPLASATDLRLQCTGFDTRALVLTHGHWDHTGDADELAETLGIPVYLGAEDAAMLETPDLLGYPLPYPLRAHVPERLLRENDIIECGTLRFRVLCVPGHTPGHIALHEAGLGILFAGDVLFRGGIGRSDLPGGSYDQLLESIVEVLLPLPDETTVYPGHGPFTTIGSERRDNPFISDYLDHFG
ncbi:MAG: MBL fold metallo-hydrolase [Ignavibacteriae bacterium]|nr:MBL fold metallo-hydrolase [Ignavibacteriota bacterium]